MKLAILLWVYKDVRVSIDRALWLRRLNPGVPLYCLYGGPLDQAEAFAEALAPLIDDFYAYAAPVTAYEKWLHADRLLAAWHDERGRDLPWDSVFVAQWDLVLTAPVARLCGSLAAGEVLFSSTRPIAEVAHFWSWLKPGSQHLADYEGFAQEIGDEPERFVLAGRDRLLRREIAGFERQRQIGQLPALRGGDDAAPDRRVEGF